MGLYVAIDIGGTKVRIEIFSKEGEALRTRIFDTPCSGDVAGEMEREIHEALDGEEPEAIGIGCPGPLDPLGGVVLNPPNLSRQWWGLELPNFLSERLGCLAALENDCNLGALGEDLYGGGREYESTLYITISTGVGGGLIVDERIFGGTRGFAVEVGHTKITEEPYVCGCGREGCVEAVASGTAIARFAREAGWGTPEDSLGGARAVVNAAHDGDEVALGVVRRAAWYMGAAIVNSIYAYDPAVVLLGGGVAQSDLYMKLVKEAVDEEPMMPAFRGTPVRRAALGERSVVCGAFALAQKSLKRPAERPSA